jgi:N-hydroxyarylamine O-acetyltransferase
MIDRLTNEDAERYLRLLDIQTREPGYEALAELVEAQLTRVPFENASKLYHKKHIGLRGLIDLDRHLDGIERWNLGGTCYANNYYLHLLLKFLGYEVKLCGADMTDPDVHLVNLVTLEGREYLVDGGYGAPLLKPIPLDLNKDYAVELGNERYVVSPRDARGYSRQCHYRDNQLIHGYTVKPLHRDIGYFREVIRDSFTDKSTFMNGLVIIRFYPNRSMAIRSFNLIESEGRNVKIRKMAGREELLRVGKEVFSIPPEVLSDAMDEIAKLNDDWK